MRSLYCWRISKKLVRQKSMGFEILVNILIFSDFPDEKLSFFVTYSNDWSIVQVHNIDTEQSSLKIRIKYTHLGFLAAKGLERSLMFQILTYWSSEHVYNRFLFDIFTSFTEERWTCWEAMILSGILASKKWRYPLSVT